jgi:chitin disaccharide deacetylase
MVRRTSAGVSVTSATRKYLIVNGDDFGASRGINRGILEAHRCGVLTSASLLVDFPASREAASLAREAPELSLGLHIDLDRFALSRGALACRVELQRQLRLFQALTGRSPTHIDSHHNVHRDLRVADHFVDLAARYGLPLREHSSARYISTFYGRWAGETHLEQISVQALARILAAETSARVAELGCHPGYMDADFSSSYAVEREAELRTLCDPDLIPVLAKLEIQLVNFVTFPHS